MKNKTINVDIEIIYIWFDLDGGIIHKKGDYKKINEAILNGNYDIFMNYYYKYNYEYSFDNKGGLDTFFPDKAAIFFNNEYIGDIDITSKTGFNMITDYKCYVR